jgi:hypothetical protein
MVSLGVPASAVHLLFHHWHRVVKAEPPCFLDVNECLEGFSEIGKPGVVSLLDARPVLGNLLSGTGIPILGHWRKNFTAIS